MIRVLVVDDSLTIRKTVAERLVAAGLDVVGEAADGLEAVKLTHALRPDVILMDVVMPHVDGLAATRQIMNEVPTPVVILSGYANQQEVFKTYDALAAGALEVCAKPVTIGHTGQKEWDNITLTLSAAAQVTVTHLRPRTRARPVPAPTAPSRPVNPSAAVRRSVVAIGASTGGPAAVKHILAHLPPSFPLPVLVALHCNSRMSSSVAGWFDRECSLSVSDAEDGAPLPKEPGHVVTAPPGHNFSVNQERMVVDEAVTGVGCSPSIDVLFSSVGAHYGERAIGVLLTGMGADGAIGLKRIKDRGGATVAQDEESCVVFGMPAAAVELSAAQHVLPLDEIPQLLMRLACRSVDTPQGAPA